MTRLNTFGLPPAVATPVLALAADIIEQAASLGPGRWGLTSYPPRIRINVGWTEIFTICEDNLRLIVDGALARESNLPRAVTLDPGDNGGGFYPSVPGSVLAMLPYSLQGKMAAAIEALQPALAAAVSLAGRRRTGRGVKAGHNQAVVEQLAAAVGRNLPAPDFQGSETDGSISVEELTHRRLPKNTLIEDLESIARQNIESTTKSALVSARVGQGAFRSQVLQNWGGCCSVTRSGILEAVSASHIKPWCQSTDQERLDPNNGLPLVASLHSLLDAGLISFSASGSMLVSSELSVAERRIFGIGEGTLTKKPTTRTAKYLAYHRKVVFRP